MKIKGKELIKDPTFKLNLNAKEILNKKKEIQKLEKELAKLRFQNIKFNNSACQKLNEKLSGKTIRLSSGTKIYSFPENKTGHKNIIIKEIHYMRVLKPYHPTVTYTYKDHMGFNISRICLLEEINGTIVE